MKSCMDELIQFLKETHNEVSAVVLPDFFHDRLITLEQTPVEFANQIRSVAERKGGSIDGIRQTDIRGGNAVNTASALAALGVKVIPIICTSKFGLQRVEYHLKPLGVDTSHVRIVGKASVTTALELAGKESRVNVMLRDLGSLADFGPSNLSEDDYKVIERADYVCVFNWAGTRQHGTELAQGVFQKAKSAGKGKTYFDTADPTPNREKISGLMEKVLKTRHLDILSLNENEAITYAAYLTKEDHSEKSEKRHYEVALESARLLAKHLHARIDLHTTAFSATFTKNSETLVPAFKIRSLRATGAGDAWDGGNIFADGNGLSAECRLTLANAVSACYLTDPDGEHPTCERLVRFLKKQKMKSASL